MKLAIQSFSLAALLLILSGCSSKEVYKPEKIKGEWKTSGRISASIDYAASNAALLENGKILTKSGESTISLPKGDRLINVDGDWSISQALDSSLILRSLDGTREPIVFDFKRTVASASVNNNFLAIVFSNNELALYSLDEKKLLFKERGEAPVAVDSRIAAPYFMKDLVLFLTLDGKIVIVNSESKQMVRSVVISSEEYFNNVTYLNIIDNHLVASTGTTALALSQKESREKFDIRNIAYSEEGVWIATKQGEIIALSPTLQFIAKKKFPFAHFVGLSVQNDRVYALEMNGYMIALTKNLLSYDVFDVNLNADNKVFAGEGRFYFDDSYINIK